MSRASDYERSGAGPIVDTFRRLEARHEALVAALATLEQELRDLAVANHREGLPDTINRGDVWLMAADRLAALRKEHQP